MSDKIDIQAIDPMFRLSKIWPWPPPFDPGPPWELIVSRLDPQAINRVIGVQLDLAKNTLVAQKGVLDAQMKAIDEMQQIMKGSFK